MNNLNRRDRSSVKNESSKTLKSDDQFETTIIVQHYANRNSSNNEKSRLPPSTTALRNRQPSTSLIKSRNNSRTKRKSSIVSLPKLVDEKPVAAVEAVPVDDSKSETNEVVFRRIDEQRSTISSEDRSSTVRSERISLESTNAQEIRSFLMKYRQSSEENNTAFQLLTKIRESTRSIPVGPIPLSQQACRFELPFDLKKLETLTPLDYLTQYCRVSNRRQFQFKRIFNKYRERDHRIEYSNLFPSIVDLHKENFTRSNYDELCQLVDIDNGIYRFAFEPFIGILAFSERLLCNLFLLKTDNDHIILSKNPIERCDFDSLARKFDGLIISEKMKRLLNSL